MFTSDTSNQHEPSQGSPVLAPKKKSRKSDSLLKKLRSGTPPAVDGRQHATLQTEMYLEELAEKVEESDAMAQTDAFLDSPSTPLFVPAKTGADVATQILPGELFDFDLEVRPVLEVIAHVFKKFRKKWPKNPLQKKIFFFHENFEF